MMIHNDLVSNFGSDLTGALGQGLSNATNPPSNLGATATADQSVHSRNYFLLEQSISRLARVPRDGLDRDRIIFD